MTCSMPSTWWACHPVLAIAATRLLATLRTCVSDVPVATTIYQDRDNKAFEHWKHPANSQVYDENIWGKAMARIAIDKWPPEKAADEAIDRMKAIFAGYK